jgi:hypothetical protein
MTTRTPLGLIAGAALFAATVAGSTLLDAPAAKAQVAAQVESETRPNFGVLLQPPTRARNRSAHRRYDYRRHRPDWDGPGYPSHRPGTEEVVLVDCGGNPGSGAVEDAVRRVRPGGTLILRARAGACVGWLNIDKPMTIIGEGGYDPRDRNGQFDPTLQAPDGLPCMTVASGVRVEIRDMVFASPRAGEAACIVGYGAEIVLNRVGFRHAGDEAAIYADGGLLDVRNARMDAQTIAPAIVADGAGLTLHDVSIEGAQVGVEVTPGAATPARITRSTIRGTGAPNAFGPRSIGLLVRSGRDVGRVEVDDSTICGFAEGVAIEGASVDINRSRICRADKGAVLYNGELKLTNSRVRASGIGVLAGSGLALVTGNSFSGGGDSRYWLPFWSEPRAVLEAEDNRVWSTARCRPSYFQRRGGWGSQYGVRGGGGQGWECVYASYPRDWWDQEDGLFGVSYADEAYVIEGYDSYRRGYGWYNREHRYVNGDRRRDWDL